MRSTFPYWIVAIFATLGAAPVGAQAPAADQKGFQGMIRPLLAKYCFHCHGEKKMEAGLRLDRLGPDLLAEKSATVWHELIDRVNAGEMPPKKEPQPTADELNRLNGWIFPELKRVAAAAQGAGGRVVLRRLNRQEYRNTIRDLVGVPFDASLDLPSDPSAFGFDNVGSAQSISPLHMEKYLLAARKVIDRAIVVGAPPKRERWRIQGERRSKEDRGYYYANDEKYGNTGIIPPEARADRGRFILWALGGEGNKFFPATNFTHLAPVEKTRFRTNVLQGNKFTYPMAGEYIIRVRAYGHYPKHKLGDSDLLGPPRLNVTSNGVRVLGCDVPATVDAPRVYETRFYTEALTTNLYVRNRFEYSTELIGRAAVGINSRGPDFPIPYLAVDWYEIDGPVQEQWPPESHARILFASKNRQDESAYAREVLTAFARRAYRRPVRAEEIDRLVAAFEKVRPKKSCFEEAIKLPLIAVLCSPHFLFMSEELPAANAAPRRLDDHELAARFSYFLWSSMPDAELFQLADNGALRKGTTLTEQVRRMLADPKSRAFVENFTGQWLGVRKLGEVPPDEKMFSLYGEHLEESMAGETRGFFAEILRNDLSVLNFIHSDFALLNERLARFYGISGVRGDAFRKVSLKPADHRGGLLTQAAILSVTSNGTRTSPVKRGVWILENILADPPPPPPPDAGEIPPPKVDGTRKATVRERLALHRSVPACAACHAKIDPLGFALENYDASGYYRVQESSQRQFNPRPQDPRVDSSGVLPDGRAFKGVEGLTQILLKEEDKFLGCLAQKMLTYALGRGLDYGDRAAVAALRDSMKQDGYHLRGLISRIVASDAFQTK